MGTATPTTTRDILGLALLAALSEKPSGRAEAVNAVRGLCLPWLTPTREVLAELISNYCEAGYLCAENQRVRDACPPSSVRLEVTAAGEDALRRLALYRTGQPAHPLVILCESLRLSVANRLDPPARDEILRGQFRARRRCLAMQQRRLINAGTENPTLAHLLRHQIACARAELDAFACAAYMDAGETPSLSHACCHRLEHAQAEPDALMSESPVDEGVAASLLPFST